MTTPIHPFQPRFSPAWTRGTRTEIALALRELGSRLGVAVTVANIVASEDGGFANVSLRLTRLAPDGTPDGKAMLDAIANDPHLGADPEERSR